MSEEMASMYHAAMQQAEAERDEALRQVEIAREALERLTYHASARHALAQMDSGGES